MNELEDRSRQKELIELVTFPSSKHFPRTKVPLAGDDPLEDLMSEYGDADEDLENFYNEEQFLQQLGIDSQILDQQNHQGPDEYLVAQLQLLEEIAQRFKYYLDEIESVLPTR